jgi:hypothetical protein
MTTHVANPHETKDKKKFSFFFGFVPFGFMFSLFSLV